MRRSLGATMNDDLNTGGLRSYQENFVMAKENCLSELFRSKIEEMSNTCSFKAFLTLIAIEIANFALKEFSAGIKEGVLSVIGG